MRSVFKILINLIALPVFSMGSDFLMLPFSVQQIAIGNHSTIGGATPTNSALFSTIDDHSNIHISRGFWIGDINLMNVSFNQSFKNKVFHLGINYSGLTGFEYRDDRPEDAPKSYFSSYGLFLKSGVSIKKNKSKFGISITYLKMGIETQESGGIGVNFGYAYQINSIFRFGASLENVGHIDDIETKEINLPSRLIGTVSSKIFPNKYDSKIYGSIELTSKNHDTKYLIGNSTNWKNLKLYSGILFSKNLIEYSTGFSVKIKSIDIGYGKRFSSHNLGTPQIISLKISLP
jgi:hypothetical protein